MVYSSYIGLFRGSGLLVKFSQFVTNIYAFRHYKQLFTLEYLSVLTTLTHIRTIPKQKNTKMFFNKSKLAYIAYKLLRGLT